MWREPALYTSLGAVAPCVYLCSWTALLRPSQTCGCRVDPFPARVKIRPTHEQTGASSGSCAQVGMVHAYRGGSGRLYFFFTYSSPSRPLDSPTPTQLGSPARLGAALRHSGKPLR